MDWSSSPTAKTFPCPPSARTSSYWARLVSWNSSTRMNPNRSRHQARRSGCSAKRVSGWSIRSSKSIAFCRWSAAASGPMSSAAIWVSRSKPAWAASCSGPTMRFLAEEMIACTARGGNSLGGKFRSSSSRRTTARRSSSSKMVNCRLKPSRSASRRSMRAERLWKGPIQRPAGAGARRVATRCFISPAALLVKVTAKIFSARTPCSSISTAIRVVSTRVLPEPAPARTSSGPCTWATASRCSGLRLRAQSRPAVPAVISAGEEPVRSEIRHQDVGNPDGAVGRLVVLQQRRDGPRERHARRVEGVHELRLGPGRRAEADVGAAGLEIGEGARARALEPGADAGGPDLEVVGARRAEPGVAARELDHPVRQAEAPEHPLGVAGQELVLRLARLGTAEPDQLDLVELMHPEEPAGVLSRRARLPAEARRECHERRGQRGRLENLVPVQVGHRHLGGGNEEEIIPRDLVLVFLELGELPGAGERVAVDEERRRHLEVAVLAGMEIEHETGEPAHQPRPQAGEEREAGARDLGAPYEIENPERLPELPVRPRREIEARRLTAGADDAIGGGRSGGDRGVGKVGESEEGLVQLPVHFAGLGVERLDPLPRQLQGLEQLVGRLPRALLPRDLLAPRVSLRLEPLGLGDKPAPAAVQLEHRVHGFADALVAAAHQPRPGPRRILAEQLQIDHFLGSPTSRARYPQYTLERIRNITERTESSKESTCIFA